jgi:hypothetical protein
MRKEKRTWSILGNHTINDGGFHAVDDVVACAGYEVAISTNFYIFLLESFSDWREAEKDRNQ